MCPFHMNDEWRHIRDTAPDDWAKAIAFDVAIRERDPAVYIHRGYVPLAEASLDNADAPRDDREAECQTGFCFV
jgi:hypothetical protein